MDYQKTLFDWIASQPGVTGAVFLAVGLVYGLCGYRLIRFLVVVPCAGLGCLLGLLLARLGNLPPAATVPALGFLAGLLAARHTRGAVIITGAATLATLGAYVTAESGASATVILIVTGVLGGGSLIVAVLSRQAMALLHTTLLGAALCVLGFVGVANAVMPSLGSAFRTLTSNCWLIVPVILVVLSITLYTYQANGRQGDILTGSRALPRL